MDPDEAAHNDPDEAAHYELPHLVLHCLQIQLFTSLVLSVINISCFNLTLFNIIYSKSS